MQMHYKLQIAFIYIEERLNLVVPHKLDFFLAW